MLVVETVLRIRRERASGKAIREISRDLRLSRKVVAQGGAQGDQCSGRGVTRIHDLHARRWEDGRREDTGGDVPAFIPVLFKPGEAYPFDWSHEDVEIAGKPMRVYSIPVLPATR